MSGFGVLTPSYAADFELCRELNQSVLECTAADVDHHLVVPRRDQELFARLRGSRTHVWTVEQLIPRRMLPVPLVNAWLNVRRPYPPVRGWVMQQIVKLGASAQLGGDLVVLADSDVVFVRPVSVDTFRKAGRVRFYRSDHALDGRLPRHLRWHDAARRLVGLPPSGPPPLPDYISGGVNVWERRVLLALRERIEQVHGRPWLDAIASNLHISEFILYGVFVDDVLGSAATITPAESTLVHCHWGPEPMVDGAVDQFVRGLRPEDVAVMISARSQTDPAVRRRALSGVRSSVALEG